MKNFRYFAALVAIAPVFALLPACAGDLQYQESEEGIVENEEVSAEEAFETPGVEPESNQEPGPCPTCTKKTFLGAGRCTASVVPGAACAAGRYYTIYSYNYENWKNCAGASLFWKTAFYTTTECRSSAPPVYCPGFCN